VKRIGPIKRQNYEVFVENSTYSRQHLKTRILEDGLIEYVCKLCNLGPVWYDKKCH
jgi:hypothetical protein